MGYQMFRTKKDATGNLRNSLEILMENMGDLKSRAGYETLNVLRVGRFIEGEAYYHETDETYTCVGFEVEEESRFDLDGTLTNLEKNVGFYSVWIGRASGAAPFTFEESFQDFGQVTEFSNGYGDHFEVHRVLATIDEVEHILENE